MRHRICFVISVVALSVVAAAGCYYSRSALGSRQLFLRLHPAARSSAQYSARREAHDGAAGILPMGALMPISATLGRDDATYAVLPVGKAFRAGNPRQGFTAEFSERGVVVANQGASFRVKFAGFGGTTDPGRVLPIARENRVEYRRGALTEWYVNGPAGLEQGFTLSAPPEERSSGTAEIALEYSGDLEPHVEKDLGGLLLKRSDGSTALRYSGLVARDADGRPLAASMQLDGNILKLVVDDRAARYPMIVDPLFQVAILTDAAAAKNISFGNSVAVSGDGNTIAVGAPGSSGAKGAVFVFEKQGASWTSMTEVRRLLGTSSTASIGGVVSISNHGDTILSSSLFGSAVAFVFVRPGTTWSGTGDLTASATLPVASGISKAAISGDGKTAAVGLFGREVDVFEEGDAWSGMVNPAAVLTPSSDLPGIISFADSVAIDDDGGVIVAGGFFTLDFDKELFPGRAWVFVRTGDAWSNKTETAILGSDKEQNNDDFTQGLTISGDGTTIVVAARNTAVNQQNQGAVYVFAEPNLVWVTRNNEDAFLFDENGGQGDDFGQSVTVSGNGAHILVGAPPVGRVSSFDMPGLAWSGTIKTPHNLTASDSVPGFGKAVALDDDGGVAVIGSDNLGGTGEAFVFTPCVSLAPGAFDFGNVLVNSTSAPEKFTLSNSCADPISNIEVSFTGPSADLFSQTNSCGSLLLGNGTCDINVKFKPTAVSESTELALLEVANSDTASSPQSATLGGTGVCGVALSPTSFDFGNVNVGSKSSTQTFQLSTQCQSPVNGVAISFTGANAADFSQTNTCAGSIPPNNFCTIDVAFTPSNGIAESANLVVAENDPSSPQQAALTGTGLGSGNFTITPTAASPSTGGSASSATVASGSSATYTLALVSTGGFNKTVALTAAFSGASLPAGTSLSFDKTSVTPVAAGVNSVLTVTTTQHSTIPPAGVWRRWNLNPAGIALALAFVTLLISILMMISAVLRRGFGRFALALCVFCAIFAMPACQSANGPATGGTAAGTYQVVVTATGGGITHTTNVTLVVQ